MRRNTNHNTGNTSIAPPTIVSISPDSNILGDAITYFDALTLSGTAVANSTVSIFDGTKLLGTVAANANGAWVFLTATAGGRLAHVHGNRFIRGTHELGVERQIHHH